MKILTPQEILEFKQSLSTDPKISEKLDSVCEMALACLVKTEELNSMRVQLRQAEFIARQARYQFHPFTYEAPVISTIVENKIEVGDTVRLSDDFIASVDPEEMDRWWYEEYRGKVLELETINGKVIATVDAGPGEDRSATWGIDRLTKV